MPKHAYAALCRAARDEDFQHLGDWLAQLPGLVQADEHIEPAGTLGRSMAQRRFVVVAAKAVNLLEALFDLVDYAPKITGDAAVFEAFSGVRISHGKLKRLFDDNFPL